MELSIFSLNQALMKTLERIFFAMPETINKEEAFGLLARETSTVLHIFIHFNDDHTSNCLHFYLHEELANELAANGLGTFEPVKDKHLVADTSKEFASMVCGSYFSDFYPNKSVSIALPELEYVQFSKYDWQKVMEQGWVYSIEQNILVMVLTHE